MVQSRYHDQVSNENKLTSVQESSQWTNKNKTLWHGRKTEYESIAFITGKQQFEGRQRHTEGKL